MMISCKKCQPCNKCRSSLFSPPAVVMSVHNMQDIQLLTSCHSDWSILVKWPDTDLWLVRISSCNNTTPPQESCWTVKHRRAITLMFWAPEHAEHEARVGREVSSTLLSPNIRIRSQFSSLQQHQLELDSILSQSWIEFYLFKLKQSSEFQPELTSFGCKVFCGNLSSIGSKSFVIGHWTRTLDLELDCDNSTENKNWPFSTTVLQFHQIRHHPPRERKLMNHPW